MRIIAGLLVCVAGLCWGQIPGLAPEKNYDVGGYVEYMANANLPDNTASSVDHLLLQRLNLEYRFSPHWRVNLGMRNRLIWGDSAKLAGYGELIGNDPGYWDLSGNWYDNDGVIGTSQFDRAYLQWDDQTWQVRAGRSRINWAMTTIWNPNDVFNAYSVYDFDYVERAGTDSLSVSRKLGFASSAELVFAPAQQSELYSYAARYLFNHRGWDIQLLGGKSGLDRVLGAGIAGDVEGAGLRGEITWFDPDRTQWQGEELSPNRVASIESDYSFGGRSNWLGRIAYLNISDPLPAESALVYLNLPLTAKTLSFTRHTFYSELGFDIDPLWRLTFSAIYYQDHSWYVMANTRYSLSDNLQLSGVLQRFDGSGDSLFGRQPATLLYAQLKWSY